MVRPWPTKPVLELARSEREGKTSGAGQPNSAPKHKAAYKRKTALGGLRKWSVSALQSCSECLQRHGTGNTHINSICQLPFTVHFRRCANVMQVPLKQDRPGMKSRAKEERRKQTLR